jgi:hypothetical protein
VALDINWGSISSIQCADGDAGAVVRVFFIAGAYFGLWFCVRCPFCVTAAHTTYQAPCAEIFVA